MKSFAPYLLMGLGLLGLSFSTVLLSALLSQWMHWGWAVAIASPTVNLIMAATIPSTE